MVERERLRVAKGVLQLEKGALEAIVRDLEHRNIHPPAPHPPTNPTGYVPPTVPRNGQAYREYLTRQICGGTATAPIAGLAEGGEFLQVCAGRQGSGGFGPGWTVFDLYERSPALEDDRDLQSPPAAWEGRFALALCNAVLEHVPYPRRVLAELHRVLAPGGLIYLEVAFWQPYGLHRAATAGESRSVGGDFWRATVDGLRVWAAAFDEISSGWADEGVVYYFGMKPTASRVTGSSPADAR